MKKVKLIHEVHDMWPATLVELGGMNKTHPFVQVVQWAENSAYRHSDAVVSIAPHAEPYMLVHGLAKGKFFHIPNGIMPEDWDQAESLPAQCEGALQKLCDKFIVGYFGGFALSNALDVLVDSAKLFCTEQSHKDIHFVMVGNGVEKERISERIVKENISNITLLDAVPKRSIPCLLKYFDCVYIGTTASVLYRFGLGMNKIYDAMMAGRPIIISTDSPDTIIEKHGCGLRVPAEDPEAIKKGILDIYSMDKVSRDLMGERGMKAVNNEYTYDSLSEKFCKVMNDDAGSGDITHCKRILLINHYAGSPQMGMEFRPYYFAREWIRMGYQVDIIAADYSHLRSHNPTVEKDFETTVIDGINYHWIKTGRYDGNGAKRAVTMFLFVEKLCRNAKKIAEEIQPDVIITSSTYPMDTYAGQKIRKIAEKLN